MPTIVTVKYFFKVKSEDIRFLTYQEQLVSRGFFSYSSKYLCKIFPDKCNLSNILYINVRIL